MRLDNVQTINKVCLGLLLLSNQMKPMIFEVSWMSPSMEYIYVKKMVNVRLNDIYVYFECNKEWYLKKYAKCFTSVMLHFKILNILYFYYYSIEFLHEEEFITSVIFLFEKIYQLNQ